MQTFVILSYLLSVGKFKEKKYHLSFSVRISYCYCFLFLTVLFAPEVSSVGRLKKLQRAPAPERSTITLTRQVSGVFLFLFPTSTLLTPQSPLLTPGGSIVLKLLFILHKCPLTDWTDFMKLKWPLSITQSVNQKFHFITSVMFYMWGYIFLYCAQVVIIWISFFTRQFYFIHLQKISPVKTFTFSSCLHFSVCVCSNRTENWGQKQVSGCAHHSPVMKTSAAKENEFWNEAHSPALVFMLKVSQMNWLWQTGSEPLKHLKQLFFFTLCQF